ncbi:MAG TPA: hypothetical protein VHM69_14235 [Rubrobacter sp.]|nr:hypothetical protein [Rubrobacter sp.]
MIKVSVEVSGASANFTADVWAESVAQAVDLASACNPGCEAKLLFPIDPDTFFAKASAEGTRLIRSEVLAATG